MVWETWKATRDLGRLYDIASVFIRYGFGDVVRRLELGAILRRAGRVLDWQPSNEFLGLQPPQRVREALEQLGPSFIKLGQIMATRVDLFSPAWIAEFEKLQHHVPPLPFEQLKPQLEMDLGQPLEAVFSEFEIMPIGSASIAQVYRARLQNGQWVIVKIRRPGIQPIMEADLRLLLQFADLIETRLPNLRVYRLKEIIEQFAHSLQRELDLMTECRNAERAAINLANDPAIVIPRVYWQWTSERVNVQEYIVGIPGRNWALLEASGLDRRKIAQQGAAALFNMVIRDGFFHADLHPGNLFYLSDHRIAFIDWGMVGQVSLRRRNQLIDLLWGLTERQIETIIDILLDWSPNEDVDEDSLAIDLEIFLDKYHNVPLKQLKMSLVLGDLIALLRRNHLSLPADLAMMVKVFITLESLGRQLDPEFNLVEEARVILRQLFLKRYSPQAVLKRTQRALQESSSLLLELPRDLRRFIKLLRTGSLQHRISIIELNEFSNRLDRAASRLSMSFVTAAFIIGTSVVVASDNSTSLFGIPLFEWLSLGAMLGGIWVFISIWRGQGRRD
ncbi:ubiquinone biosynthesis protein UbiB [Thioflexithrix psekupsensis]|uniref:Ubiquinone biosynthesis protein UbiB n=2 Tax=Thioflexithrix psekupsensis TaxID=1570016 RepID=A0A251XA76_9GAMM|nr:ubiquinone biosynthesis protein UbiB [Thioflexithrix psekupsensis]